MKEKSSVEIATATGLSNYEVLMGLMYIERLAQDGESPPTLRLHCIIDKIHNLLIAGGWREGEPVKVIGMGR